MREAAAMARGSRLDRDPNPRVGAVLLSAAGQVIGRGVHRGAGSPHAEVEAIADAHRHGSGVEGSTLVVTLEPCHHHGRTGPCVDALLGAGVERVVFGQPDPNPVAAGGAVALADAGVAVVGGVLVKAAEALNPYWTFAMRERRPFVTWKLAGTLDGRSAAADSTSKWITGPQARADVQRLRAQCDVVLVGTGTVVADDPALTLRGPDGEPLPALEQPLRAVMGLREIDARHQVFDEQAQTLRLRTREPATALEQLFAAESRHVLLEGGPTLAAAFWRAGLVDEVVAYVAPMILGSGAACVGDLGIRTLADAPRLTLRDVARIGADVRLTLAPSRDAAEEEAD